MKKSSQITLTVVATIGLAACRRRHPCEAAGFNQQTCQEAVGRGGYCWQGTWYPMTYHYPYFYSYDSYRRHVLGGER